MEKHHPPIQAWKPLQLLTLIGVCGFKLLVLLPWPVLRILGRTLGLVFFYLIPIRRHIVLTNLRLAFPNLSEKERKELAKEHYRSAALGFFETCRAWWCPVKDLPSYTLEGMENLHDSLKRGRGALMLSTHMTTLELCARMMVENHPFGAFYRDPNNPVIANEMRKQRETRLSIAIHFDDLRGLVRALRGGHSMWYAPDQSKKTKFSEILPFFGEPAITNTATSRIVQMGDCPIVPFVGFCKPDGTYKIIILPALENYPSEDPIADAIRINHVMEDLIRNAPAQYLWLHKRYKARGPGYPEAYKKP